MSEKPKIKFKTKNNYETNYILSASPEADALFQLLGKNSIGPKDLHYIHRMGFDIEFIGDIKELNQELKRLGPPSPRKDPPQVRKGSFDFLDKK